MADGAALARAALAGNPSDGYGGAVLALTIPAFAAWVTLSADSGATASSRPRLIDATLARFEREFGHGGRLVAWESSIPRSVGLGGSSAIVVATLRALCQLHEVRLAPAVMAELALSIERDDLGIAAGLQDRVAQCYGGLTFMDFAEPRSYRRLDAGALPPLLIAWRAHAAEPSTVVHSDLRMRHQRGEAAVRAGIDELAELARRACAAVIAADGAELARCADGSFDVRARIMKLDPRHVEMVKVARSSASARTRSSERG